MYTTSKQLTNQRKNVLSEGITRTFTLKDPASAITHFIGIILTLMFLPVLLMKANMHHSFTYLLSTGIFALSMLLLYSASTFYHAITASEGVTRRLQKWDHMMIYVLIAGTYTPICMLVLPAATGHVLLALIWGLAAAGLLLTAFWVSSPKWLNSTIYIAMGWLCVFELPAIRAGMPAAAVTWLFAGGIIYTIGGVIYALKLKVFNELHPGFGNHEIFHLFVLGGSICHFIMVAIYLV